MIYWNWLETCLDYLTGVRLILRYIGLRLTKKILNYLAGLGLIMLYNRVELKKWINQEEVPLEKYEDFFKLSAKQFVIQSNPISLGQIMCGVWKPNITVVSSKVS